GLTRAHIPWNSWMRALPVNRLFSKACFLLPVAVVALLVAGCGGGGGASADLAKDDIATVGAIHLTKTRFQDELNRAKASLTSQGQTFPKEGSTEYESIKAQAIWLLVQGAAREI